MKQTPHLRVIQSGIRGNRSFIVKDEEKKKMYRMLAEKHTKENHLHTYTRIKEIR